jgi:hypothetical protein
LLRIASNRFGYGEGGLRVIPIAADHQNEKVSARTLYRYLTNVLAPLLLPLLLMARLYACRWDIELAFNLVKGQLKIGPAGR